MQCISIYHADHTISIAPITTPPDEITSYFNGLIPDAKYQRPSLLFQVVLQNVFYWIEKKRDIQG